MLLTKYYSGDQIERNEIAGACSTYGGEERCFQGLMWEPEEKRPLGKPSRKWEYKIRYIFRSEMGA